MSCYHMSSTWTPSCKSPLQPLQLTHVSQENCLRSHMRVFTCTGLTAGSCGSVREAAQRTTKQRASPRASPGTAAAYHGIV